MKIILLLLSFIGFIQAEKPVSNLNGKWKLEKVKRIEEVLIPEKRAYHITFSDDLISYNLEVNQCQVRNFTITDSLISLGSSACTKVCCDGRNEPISNYINYNGSYTILDTTLIITNKESIFYFTRSTIKE
jgi:hypothetical protein